MRMKHRDHANGNDLQTVKWNVSVRFKQASLKTQSNSKRPTLQS